MTMIQKSPRLDVIEHLIGVMRDALLAVEVKYSVAELVSALLSLTAHASEVMLAMSSEDAYHQNLQNVLNGIKQLEARLSPLADRPKES
jgi:hypothetical protein